MVQMRERYTGSLLGLAVGDCVGAPIEFERPGSFQPITDMMGGGPFDLRKGEYTDDTSMALCSAKSLLECKGFDPLDQMNSFRKWYEYGYMSSIGHCFDIGVTTREAIMAFVRTMEPFSGPMEPSKAGNGSMMRLAPVPLYYAENPRHAIEVAADASRLTHGTVEAVDACRYFAGLIVGAVNGASKEELLSPMYSPVPSLWDEEPLAKRIADVAKGSFQDLQPPDIQGSGYVVKSLEAALWAFYHSDTYKDGLLLAVNLGDDADTTGAVYGQLAGAFYGSSAIPKEWVTALKDHDMIRQLAGELYHQRIVMQL